MRPAMHSTLPAHCVCAGVITIDRYFSAWRCATISSPWAGGQPACELVLLHHDELKVPEYLSGTAIKMGMWCAWRRATN